MYVEYLPRDWYSKHLIDVRIFSSMGGSTCIKQICRVEMTQ